MLFFYLLKIKSNNSKAGTTMHSSNHNEKDKQPLQENPQGHVPPQTQGIERPVHPDSPIRLHETDVDRVVVLGYD